MQNGNQNMPSNEEIAERAYSIYEREGRIDGRDMDNWLKAEAEIRSERQAQGMSMGEAQSSQPSPGNGDRNKGSSRSRKGQQEMKPQSAGQRN